MIHYLCSQEHLYTVEQFLTHWAPDLASHVNRVPYQDVVSGAATPQPGVYIFADLERLSPLGMEIVVRFRQSLTALGDKALLTEVGQGHDSYLWKGAATYPQTTRTINDWLRWGLYGDAAARARLRHDAAPTSATKWESSL